MFSACELGIGVLKAVNLEYTTETLQKEMALLIGMVVIETINSRLEDLVLRVVNTALGHFRCLPPLPAATSPSPGNHPVCPNAQSPTHRDYRRDRFLPHNVPSKVVHLMRGG